MSSNTAGVDCAFYESVDRNACPGGAEESTGGGGGGGNACFSERTTVQVKGKGTVSMKNVQVGDYVMSSPQGDTYVYDQVYALGHYDPDTKTEFLQVSTDNGHQVELTKEHLIYLEGKNHPARADSIKIGDVLQSQDAINGVKVIHIKKVQRKGLYAPMTTSGTLLVDGIKASSYIALQKNTAEYVEIQSGLSTGLSHHSLVHIVSTPFRLFCQTFPDSERLCQPCREFSGMPAFVFRGLRFADWVDQQHGLVQSILFIGIMLLFGSIYASEYILKTIPWVPISIILLLGVGCNLLSRLRKKLGRKGCTSNKCKTV